MAAISFLSLFSPHFFFPPAFTAERRGQSSTSPSPPPSSSSSTAACLPGRAVRWRERLSFRSECVTAVRSGTSRWAPASALMLSGS